MVRFQKFKQQVIHISGGTGAACGANVFSLTSGHLTTNHNQVTCLRCMKTNAYRTSAMAAPRPRESFLQNRYPNLSSTEVDAVIQKSQADLARIRAESDRRMKELRRRLGL